MADKGVQASRVPVVEADTQQSGYQRDYVLMISWYQYSYTHSDYIKNYWFLVSGTGGALLL